MPVKDRRPNTKLITIGIVVTLAVTAIVAASISTRLAWIDRTTHNPPKQTDQTQAGLAKITALYAGYTAASNDYSRQPAAQRDAYLQSYLSADLLKKVGSITDFDAIVCSYGGLPQSVTYGAPFLSSETGAQEQSTVVVVNVTFHYAEGPPNQSTGVHYDPVSQKITHIDCAYQAR